jgi:hypothetical protein
MFTKVGFFSVVLAEIDDDSARKSERPAPAPVLLESEVGVKKGKGKSKKVEPGKQAVLRYARPRDPNRVMIRARVSGDLENLRKTYMFKLGPTLQHGGTDYPYRALISKKEFAKGVARIAMDVDYGNFKSKIAELQGWDREQLYSRVWGVMAGAEVALKKKGRDAAWSEWDYPRSYSTPSTSVYGTSHATGTYVRPGDDVNLNCTWCDASRSRRNRWSPFCSKECRDRSDEYYGKQFETRKEKATPRTVQHSDKSTQLVLLPPEEQDCDAEDASYVGPSPVLF